MVFLFESLLLVVAGALSGLNQPTGPLWPTWLIGAALAWTAFRISVAYGPVRGALVAQSLPALWLPFLVSVFPLDRCANPLFESLETLSVLFLVNAVVLAVVAGRWVHRSYFAKQR